MAKLENLIRENRKLFDDKEPDKNHEKRFMEKINYRKELNHVHFLRVAAVIFFGLLLFSAGYRYLIKNDGVSQQAITNLDPELRNAVYYYDTQNMNMMDTIKSMSFPSEDTKKNIIEDIKNYDNNYKNVVSDLRKYPDNERVINAFIEYYRSKTELLGYIIAQLNETNPNQRKY